MKKLIVTAMFLAASTAFAQGFGGVEYSSRDGVDGTADSSAIKLIVGKKVNDTWSVDLSSRLKKEDNSNTNDTRLEAGVTASTSVGNGFSVYTRGAIGEKYKSSDNYAYYSIEPGVKYAVTPQLTAKVGYRFRDTFTDSKADQTNTYRLGAEYALSKSYTLGLGYDRVRGDSDYNAINATVGFKF